MTGGYSKGYPDQRPICVNLLRKESVEEYRKILVSVGMKVRILKSTLCSSCNMPPNKTDLGYLEVEADGKFKEVYLTKEMGDAKLSDFNISSESTIFLKDNSQSHIE